MNKTIVLITLLAALIGLLAAVVTYQAALKSAGNFNQSKEVTKQIVKNAVQKNNEELQKLGGQDTPLSHLPFVETEIKDLDLRLKFGLERMKTSISKYKPGSYLLAEYNSCKALLIILESVVNRLCEKNINDSLMLDTKIIGFADGLRVKENSRYKGNLGDVVKLDYYSMDDSNYKSETLVRGITEMKNEYFAVLRAFDMKKYLEQLDIFKANRCRFEIQAKTTNKIGPQYRKVIIDLTIKNAFLKDYEELNFLEKGLYDRKYKGQKN